jgi:predicted DNA-binding transcriptional regulator AlpA
MTKPPVGGFIPGKPFGEKEPSMTNLQAAQDESDDLVYDPTTGHALDVLPPSWVLPASWLVGDAPTDVSSVENAREPIPTDRLLDVNKAARYCGCHPNTIYQATKAGALRCRRIGRLKKWTIPDLDEWTEGAR